MPKSVMEGHRLKQMIESQDHPGPLCKAWAYASSAVFEIEGTEKEINGSVNSVAGVSISRNLTFFRVVLSSQP